MHKSCLTARDTVKNQDDILKSSNYYYGCKYKDEYLFTNPLSLPLYGHLARKLIMHYAGDHYNPHTMMVAQEQFIRMMIKSMVEYKIFYKLKEYDWEYIDHFFKKVVGEYYDLNLPYDPKIIKRSYGPNFAAPAMIDFDTAH